MKKRLRCKVCGHRFAPTKEAIYSAKEPQSMAEALTKSATVYEMVDCPACGCQNAISIRYPRIEDPAFRDKRKAGEAIAAGVAAGLGRSISSAKEAFEELGRSAGVGVTDEETIKEQGADGNED